MNPAWEKEYHLHTYLRLGLRMLVPRKVNFKCFNFSVETNGLLKLPNFKTCEPPRPALPSASLPLHGVVPRHRPLKDLKEKPISSRRLLLATAAEINIATLPPVEMKIKWKQIIQKCIKMQWICKYRSHEGWFSRWRLWIIRALALFCF